jgi:predicted pyridoxine 5'-phosphate oxidase superfamily flavin-nucleotide-binding protein
MSVISTIEQLEATYSRPNEASTVKVADWITPAHRVLIDKSPFALDEIYFQCARAIVRSDLWNPDKRVDPKACRRRARFSPI